MSSLGRLSLEGRFKNVRHDVVEVTTERLDDVSFGRPPRLLKIDVEGQELEVLRGAERMLRDAAPVVLVEVEQRHRDGDVQEVFDYLASLGYEGSFVRGGVAAPARLIRPRTRSAALGRARSDRGAVWRVRLRLRLLATSCTNGQLETFRRCATLRPVGGRTAAAGFLAFDRARKWLERKLSGGDGHSESTAAIRYAVVTTVYADARGLTRLASALAEQTVAPTLVGDRRRR